MYVLFYLIKVLSNKILKALFWCIFNNYLNVNILKKLPDYS